MPQTICRSLPHFASGSGRLWRLRRSRGDIIEVRRPPLGVGVQTGEASLLDNGNRDRRSGQGRVRGVVGERML